ncbi:secretin receptor [Trichinella spiralis]|uniref:secretin receptor n=1 Tax=Trichinella spiralis TaxID=6334 RepID=UPI0001EFC838|nr:secretin receptor [Trichinella spiralis]
MEQITVARLWGRDEKAAIISTTACNAFVYFKIINPTKCGKKADTRFNIILTLNEVAIGSVSDFTDEKYCCGHMFVGKYTDVGAAVVGFACPDKCKGRNAALLLLVVVVAAAIVVLVVVFATKVIRRVALHGNFISYNFCWIEIPMLIRLTIRCCRIDKFLSCVKRWPSIVEHVVAVRRQGPIVAFTVAAAEQILFWNFDETSIQRQIVPDTILPTSLGVALQRVVIWKMVLDVAGTVVLVDVYSNSRVYDVCNAGGVSPSNETNECAESDAGGRENPKLTNKRKDEKKQKTTTPPPPSPVEQLV